MSDTIEGRSSERMLEKRWWTEVSTALHSGTHASEDLLTLMFILQGVTIRLQLSEALAPPSREGLGTSFAERLAALEEIIEDLEQAWLIAVHLPLGHTQGLIETLREKCLQRAIYYKDPRPGEYPC